MAKLESHDGPLGDDDHAAMTQVLTSALVAQTITPTQVKDAVQMLQKGRATKDAAIKDTRDQGRAG